MNIVSDFIDYYDDRVGIESTYNPPLTYFRRTVSCPPAMLVDLLSYVARSRQITYSTSYIQPEWYVVPFIIGFCGFLYHGIKLKNNITEQREISYTQGGLLHLADRLGIRIPSSVTDRLNSHLDSFRYRHDDVFRLVKTPLFLISLDRHGNRFVIRNPRLAELDFFKVCRADDTFRNIRKFIAHDLKHSEYVTRNVSKEYDFDLALSGWSNAHHRALPVGY